MAVHRGEQGAHACGVSGDDLVERGSVVAAATPAHGGQVGAVVVDADVVERREQALVDRLPQPQLDAGSYPDLHPLLSGI